MRELETYDEYKEFLEEHPDKLVIIDFHAEWCGPCKMMGPKFENLEEEEKYGDKVVYAKVDVDENEETAEELDIEGMPTFILYVNGETVNQMVGDDFNKLLGIIDEEVAKV
ncbi:unnamed protein product [Moneuplotes crassus]|uniref:Thioredoxin domain-containing protein n=1 Tax=Euplotes crassus TaxID=5936 RepID=A0AAD1XVN8_EUPCR|nr:unnamed protein product [Moneuplotes crassus]